MLYKAFKEYFIYFIFLNFYFKYKYFLHFAFRCIPSDYQRLALAHQ